MTPTRPINAIKSRRIVTPSGVVDGCVIFEKGKIVAIVNSGEMDSDREMDSNREMEDVGNWVVMPGLVDSHVHINEPGRTEWEGFRAATQAAAAGGVTTLVDMPLNSSPVTTSVEALEQKLEAAKDQLFVDCGFYGGLVPDNQDHLEALIERGVLGIKAFLIDSGIDEFRPVGKDELQLAMPILARQGVHLLVHAELPTNSSTPAVVDVRSPAQFARSRPAEWEANAIDLLVALCLVHSCPVHIVHLAASVCLEKLHDARASGLPITVETCPHYLYFDMDSISDGSTIHKCAPPIRDRENAEALWQGLVDGQIDFVVSDHSPSLPALKCLDEGNFSKAWGGISSLQLGLSVVWTLAQRRGYTIEDVTRWMCTHPARFLGLESSKGSIAPGLDADLVVFNPDATKEVRTDELFSRHKLSPYTGHMLSGEVKITFLGGHRVYEDHSFSDAPRGSILLRHDD